METFWIVYWLKVALGAFLVGVVALVLAGVRRARAWLAWKRWLRAFRRRTRG